MENDTFTVNHITILEQQVENMSEELNTLPLELTFSLGSREFTLAELEELQVGSSFTLPCDVTSPVTIFAQKTPFAKGQLLEIEGKIGVQITEFLLGKEDV